MFHMTLLAESIRDMVEADFCAVSRLGPNLSVPLAKSTLTKYKLMANNS